MSEFLSTFMGDVIYSILGFVLGWVLGKEARAIEDYRERRKAMSEEMSREEDHPVRFSKLGIFVIVLALFTVLQAAYFSYEQRQSTQCLADYNENLFQVEKLHTEWTNEDREQMLVFLETLDEVPPPTDEETHQALVRLRDHYETNLAKRQNTPLPPFPDCDEDGVL